MNNWFIIPERLPGYNEQADADRRGPHVGAKLRKDTEQRIALYIRAAVNCGHCRRIEHPCTVRLVWTEKNRRRDIDNVVFAKKYILDAMQAAGILPDDSQKWVRGFVDEVMQTEKGAYERVYVSILEETEGKEHG